MLQQKTATIEKSISTGFIAMGWLPFTSKKVDSSSGAGLAGSQVEQKSHTPIGLSPQGNESDISHTLEQITTDKELTLKDHGFKSPEEANNAVEEFVHKRPDNVFVIDGEKDIKQSIICTNNESGGKTCLKLQYNSIELFKQMQKLEYFCSLPEDIDATYFECRKIK